MFTLDQLRVFDAVVRVGTFLGAAQKLHQTQPAISMTIKRLEEIWGTTLFSRQGLRPVLTDKGKILHQRAIDLLRTVDVFSTDVKTVVSGIETSLHIAVGAIVPIMPAARRMRLFMEKHTSTRFIITVENIGEAISRVLKGEIDIAVSPLISDSTGYLDAHPIGKIAMVPVMAMAQAREKTDLKKLPQIILTSHDESGRGADFDTLPGGKTWVVNDLHAKRELILSGMGWGGLPEHLITDDLRKKRLQEICTKRIKRQKYSICLLRDRRRLHGPVAVRLWNHLK